MPGETLTRIRLNRRNSEVRRDLADSVQLHRTLMQLLPQDLGPQPRKAGGLLFRLEPGPRPVLLVQTSIPPLITQLPLRYGAVETRDLQPMFSALTTGLTVRYHLAANAVTRVPDPTCRCGYRLAVLRGEEALTWWRRRARAAGMALDTTATSPGRYNASRIRPGLRHALTHFEGVATVSDPTLLTDALRTGIGRGKAFGAGLLSLAPT